jgi:hypothetical protein
MGKQLHKRLPKEFVVGIIEGFDFGRITEKQAVEALGIKRAQLYRLREKWLKGQGEAERFSLYSPPEHINNQLPEAVEQFLHKELTYINTEAKYFRGKFNFELISERLDQEYRIKIHRSTIRRWAIKKGYYNGDHKKTRKVYVRFEMSGPGEMYQHDSSNHVWLPNTGRHHDLIATKDDHSRLVVNGILVEQETSWKHIMMTRETIEKYGMPLVYYVDNHSTFRSAILNGVHNKSLPWKEEGVTQFGRVLESLGIGLRYAPKGEGEAKGKIEKQFDYFQRRIPYLCEKYKVTNLTEANRILREEVIPYYNERHEHEETHEIPIERWKKGIAEGRSKLRAIPWGAKMDLIFSLQFPRKVRRDGTIQFHNRAWSIGAFVDQTVTVCLIPQKKFVILKGNEKIWEYHL